MNKKSKNGIEDNVVLESKQEDIKPPMICPRCGIGIAIEKPGVEVLPLMRYQCLECQYPFNKAKE